MNNNIYKILASSLILPALIPLVYIFMAEETRVCGVDGLTYPSLENLEKAGLELSYDFPCQNIKSEEGLYERKEDIAMVGMYLDYKIDEKNNRLFLVIKENVSQKEYFIIYNDLEKSRIFEYITGDQVKLSGEWNKNTYIIEANELENLSLRAETRTFDCLVLVNNLEDKQIGCLDNEREGTVELENDTRILVNGALVSLDSIDTGDLLRVRMNDEKTALIIKLKDGDLKLFREKADILTGKVTEFSDESPVLELEDGDNIKLKTRQNTRIVKKYFGKMDLPEIGRDDALTVYGIWQHDGSFLAMTIKNNSVWK